MTIAEAQIVDWTFAGRLDRASDDKTDSKRRTTMAKTVSRDLDVQTLLFLILLLVALLYRQYSTCCCKKVFIAYLIKFAHVAFALPFAPTKFFFALLAVSTIFTLRLYSRPADDETHSARRRGNDRNKRGKSGQHINKVENKKVLLYGMRSSAVPSDGSRFSSSRNFTGMRTKCYFSFSIFADQSVLARFGFDCELNI